MTSLGERDYAGDVSSKTDPRGRSYFWIGGLYRGHSREEGSDCSAIDAKFVSITPVELIGRGASVSAKLKELEGLKLI